MYCIGTIKQLKYGFEGYRQFSPPFPCLFPSAAALEKILALGNGNYLYPA